jgi:hypothetical protein
MRYTNTNIIIAHNNINNTIAGIIISRKNDDEDDEEDEDKSDSEEDEDAVTDADADADDDDCDCEEDEAPENADLLLSNMPVTPSES